MNAINMLGYTKIANNQRLAKDIWNGKLTVEYTDTGGDYGNYTQGETKIALNSKLLGGGREESARLATVMSHEGTHAYGNRIEGIAHLYGNETYNQLNKMFGLKADSELSRQMMNGILDSENWKENSGDVDHWKKLSNGNMIWDGQFDLVDENDNLLAKAKTERLYDSYAQFMGITAEEAKTYFESNELNVSFKDKKLLSYNPETGKYDIDRTNDESFQFETSDSYKAAYDFQVNYADKVGYSYPTMSSAFNSWQTATVLETGLTGSLGDYLRSPEYLNQMIGLREYSSIFDNYMANYFNSEKSCEYNSVEAANYMEIIRESVANGTVTNDFSGYEAFTSGGVLNSVDNENVMISTKASYDDGTSHLFGNPKGFSVDISTFGQVGYSVYTNTGSWLYSDSVFDNPAGTSYGSEVRLYGDNSTYIYGHLQESSSSRTELTNLANATTRYGLWRTYLPAGTQIGNVGNTGHVQGSIGPNYGAHLHWEYRRGYQR